MSIVYRSSERRDGSQRDGLGPPDSGARAAPRYNKCKAARRKRERQSDMGKLDPEREIAGGKVLVFTARARRCDGSFF